MEAGTNIFDRLGCELVAESVRAGHDVRIRVNGTSMLASIWPGDAITVRPVRDATALDLDRRIVLYTRDGRLFAHRVVGTRECAGSLQFITRGDAHGDCDPPVMASEILGTVEAIRRGGRDISVSSRPARRMLSFGLRHSRLLRRAALKIHSIRRRSWTEAQI